MMGVLLILALLALAAIIVALGALRRNRELEARVAQLGTELETAAALLEEQSGVDALTGLANRRAFDDRLRSVWADHARSGQSFSLVLANADRFAWFNEHHGREAGDAGLRAIARAMQGVVERPTDLLARFEGDAMVALLPNTNAEGAEFVAEAMAEEVRKLRLPHEHCPYGVQTISVGVAATVPGQDEEAGKLLEAALSALEQARIQGGDQVVSSP